MPAASGGCSKEECLDLNFGRNAVLWIGVVLLLFGLFNLFQGSTRGPQPGMPELSNLPMGGGLRQAAHPPSNTGAHSVSHASRWPAQEIPAGKRRLQRGQSAVQSLSGVWPVLGHLRASTFKS